MGRIFQINVSDGGVPKLAVREVLIHENGVTGDRQRDLRHHGGPERAVCLFSLERLLALQAEGHPIFPGAAGENITLNGLDWDVLVPGKRLRLGIELLLEITHYTVPCENLTEYFKEGGFRRISQQLYPGWSRLYARVLVPGRVRVGEAVTLLST